MTTNARFDRDLENLLHESSSARVPAGLHAEAMERARLARQRPAWLIVLRSGNLGSWPWTLRSQHPGLVYIAILGLLVVAVAAIAIVAGVFRSDPPILHGRSGSIAYSYMSGPGSITDQAALLLPDGSTKLIGTYTCPTFSGDGTVLTLRTHDHAENGDLFADVLLAGADGSSPRSLGLGGFWPHALSPDARHVAWATPGEGVRSELWVMTTDRARRWRLAPGPAGPTDWYAAPVWSPDGQWIAFTTMHTVSNGENTGSYRTAISVVRTDGQGLRAITTRPGTDMSSIAWSPDSGSIAYLGLPDGSPLPSLGADTTVPPDSFYPPESIFIRTLSTNDDAVVDLDGRLSGQLSWAPSGEYLGMVAGIDGGTHLATLPMNGRSVAGPLRVGPIAALYAWSADGATLLFTHSTLQADRSQAGRTAIDTIGANLSGTPTRLLEVNSRITCLSWQWRAP